MALQGGALLDRQIDGLEMGMREERQELLQMRQTLREVISRLPANGGPCHAMTIVAAREPNARSSRWMPVVNNAGNAPNPIPTAVPMSIDSARMSWTSCCRIMARK